VTDDRDNAGVVAPPPLIYLGVLTLVLLLDKKLSIPFLPRSIARTLGWSLLVAGVSLMGWFFFTMQRADTPIDPRVPVSNLATDGPFRYTRNPAYLSMTLIYAALSSLANALSCILLLPRRAVGHTARRDFSSQRRRASCVYAALNSPCSWLTD
jgi:protein-S-isoprenylcysteine O-methyltransferase Ste14